MAVEPAMIALGMVETKGLVGAMECPSVEPVFLCDALTIATQSTIFH